MGLYMVCVEGLYYLAVIVNASHWTSLAIQRNLYIEIIIDGACANR